MEKFLSTEFIKQGYYLFKEKMGFWIVLSLIYSFTNFSSDLNIDKFKDLPLEVLFIFGIFFSLLKLVFFYLEMAVMMGFIDITLKYIRGNKDVNYSDLFKYVSDFKKVVYFAIAYIIYGLLVVVGSILLIIPGIYFAIKYGCISYLMVDKNLGISEAAKFSAELTKGVKLNLFTYGLLCIGIIILGLLALIVGVIVAIPVIWLSSALVYDWLLKNKVEIK